MKRHSQIGFVVLVSSLLMFMGCSEVIDLDSDTIGGQLVISGRITNGTQGNVINILRTKPEQQAPERISGARVKVIDLSNNQEEELNETEPGQYELCRDVVEGEVGGQYQLVVELGGKTYTSSTQEMMPILARDELRFELDIQDNITGTGTAISTDVVRVFASSTLENLPDEFFIRWTMEEVYTVSGLELPVRRFPFYQQMTCYITNELSSQDIFLVDGTEIRNVNLNNREVAIRPVDFTFINRHYFNIIQFALNKEAHEYWKTLRSLTTRQGSIFDSPPAPVPGNITSSDPNEDVFGFFEASSVDTARLLITNNDIPLFFLDPCAISQDDFFRIIRVPRDCVQCIIEENIVEAECIFCNLLPNSSTVRPSYF